MLFETMLSAMRGGNACNRQSWTDGYINIDPSNDSNILLTASTGVTNWNPTSADLLSTDWQPGNNNVVVVPTDPVVVDPVVVDPVVADPAPVKSRK